MACHRRFGCGNVGTLAANLGRWRKAAGPLFEISFVRSANLTIKRKILAAPLMMIRYVVAARIRTSVWLAVHRVLLGTAYCYSVGWSEVCLPMRLLESSSVDGSV